MDYSTPSLRVGDGVAGSWFLQLARSAEFPAAWYAAVEQFRNDPDILSLATENGHGFNYGDLIDHGRHILRAHG